MTDIAQNIAELKTGNRYRILQCLRHEELSRAKLSRITGLTKSSVTTLTNEMIDEGLLYEAGPAEKSKKAGRTAVLLDINGSYAFAVGINLHRKRISVSATDIKGKVIFEFAERTDVFSSSENILKFIKRNIAKEVKKADLDMQRLIGIGVSSPGPLDYENGIILTPPDFPIFNNFPIVSRLKEDYGCPVFLENNAVALALFEHYHLHEQTGNFLFVVITDGIGGALIKNGEVYRGSYGTSCELGHISIDFNGDSCPCGNRGCLERYATLSSLKRRFGFNSYPEVLDKALDGDKKQQETLDFLVTALGSALGNAVNLFDVDEIIFFGEYAYRADILAEKLERYISSFSVVGKVHRVNVVPSKQNGDTSASAAAVTAINHFFKNNTLLKPF